METRAEVREAIRQDLQTWVAEGIERPCIPVYADLDGDGVPDFYALDAFGRVVAVNGLDLSGYTRVDELDRDREVGP